MSLDYTELVIAEFKGFTSRNPNLCVVEVIQNNHEHFQREFLVGLKPRDEWLRHLTKGDAIFLLNKFWAGDKREFTEVAPLQHQMADYQHLAPQESVKPKFDFEEALDQFVIDVEASGDTSVEKIQLLPATEGESDSVTSRPNNSIHIKNLEDSFMDEFDEVLQISGFRYKTMLAKRLVEIGLPIYKQIYGDLLECNRRP